MKRKDYATAILLNLFFPGTGYVYAGRAVIGGVVLLLFLAALAGMWMATSAAGASLAQTAIGFLSLVGAVDGYLTVRAHNGRIDDFAAAQLVPCPWCAERIQREARVCRFCQREVTRAG